MATQLLLTEREGQLVAELYEQFRDRFLDGRFGRWRYSSLDLHSVFVDAIVSAVRSWCRNGHEGNPAGYVYTAAMIQLKQATGEETERNRYEQSLDAPPVRRQRIRGVGGEPVYEVLAGRHPEDTARLAASPAVPASEHPDVEALAGLVVTTMKDGAITKRQAEAVTRFHDLDGHGAATSFAELGEALGIGRSAAHRLYKRGLDGLTEYVRDNDLTIEGLTK